MFELPRKCGTAPPKLGGAVINMPGQLLFRPTAFRTIVPMPQMVMTIPTIRPEMLSPFDTEITSRSFYPERHQYAREFFALQPRFLAKQSFPVQPKSGDSMRARPIWHWSPLLWHRSALLPSCRRSLRRKRKI